MKRCECEHITHFEDAQQAHVYGAMSNTTPLETDFGPFNICAECHDSNHMFAVIEFLRLHR